MKPNETPSTYCKRVETAFCLRAKRGSRRMLRLPACYRLLLIDFKPKPDRKTRTTTRAELLKLKVIRPDLWSPALEKQLGATGRERDDFKAFL